MPKPTPGVARVRKGTCFKCSRAIYDDDLETFRTAGRDYHFHKVCLEQERREIDSWNRDARASNTSVAATQKPPQ
jgi:hypothetical protein